MPNKKYCYACRVYHEPVLMVQHPTRRGLRWRCRESIEQASAPVAVRDAFGRSQTQINKETAQRSADFLCGLSRYRVITL